MENRKTIIPNTTSVYALTWFFCDSEPPTLQRQPVVGWLVEHDDEKGDALPVFISGEGESHQRSGYALVYNGFIVVPHDCVFDSVQSFENHVLSLHKMWLKGA